MMHPAAAMALELGSCFLRALSVKHFALSAVLLRQLVAVHVYLHPISESGDQHNASIMMDGEQIQSMHPRTPQLQLTLSMDHPRTHSK